MRAGMTRAQQISQEESLKTKVKIMLIVTII